MDADEAAVVNPLREPEMSGVERRGPLAIAYGQGDVIQRHLSIIARTTCQRGLIGLAEE